MSKWLCLICNSRYKSTKEADKCCKDKKWTRKQEVDATVKNYLERAEKLYPSQVPEFILEIAKMIQREEL